MIKSDKYGKIIDYKVNILMYSCPMDGCGGYHYSISGLYVPYDNEQPAHWFDTGIDGVEPTREKAFEIACIRFDSTNN